MKDFMCDWLREVEEGIFEKYPNGFASRCRRASKEVLRDFLDEAISVEKFCELTEWKSGREA